MRILWVEDRGDVVKTSIFEKKIFKNFWTKLEVENLTILEGKLSDQYKYDLQNYSTPLFLAADLEDAWEIIKKEKPFDKIIIDIEFPSEDFDFDNKYIKDSFHGEESDFQKIIDFINKDEYMGFTLAHLIISYYKDKFNWNPKENKIVFFSANSVTMENFNEKLKKSSQKDFFYDTDTKKIIQFNKNKENDFLKWLEVDEYSIILDRYINSNASSEFIKILNNKNTLENIRSLFDTILKKIANELNRKMLIDLKEPFYWSKSNYNKNNYEKLVIFKNGEVNITHFIKYLADNNLSRNYIDFIKNNGNNDEEKNIKKERRRINFLLNDKLNVTIIIQHALYSITEICNKYENHKNYIDGYTKETVETIHAQLKQIILWFGQVMEKIENNEQL
jgi:hypothetical protein